MVKRPDAKFRPSLLPSRGVATPSNCLDVTVTPLVPLHVGNGAPAPRPTVGGMVTIRVARDNGQPSATGVCGSAVIRGPHRAPMHAVHRLDVGGSQWCVHRFGLRYSRSPPRGGLREDGAGESLGRRVRRGCG